MINPVQIGIASLPIQQAPTTPTAARRLPAQSGAADSSIPRPVEPAPAAAEVGRQLDTPRGVQIRSFHDEASGRYVYQVEDTFTGELLTQLPPEELLRFFASLRAASSSVRVDC
jgi:hypothetical protein